MAFLTQAANRGSISTGYDIDNSVKFEADNREYLRWTNFSSQASAARKKKFTFSVWVKRTELGGNQQVFISTSQNGYLTFEANNQLTWIQQYGGSQLVINTTRVFRDTSAWYHIMVVVDTAQSTEADRTKIYVNGEQETVFDAAAYPSQNAEASNLFEQHLIVGEWGGTSLGFCGYMAEYYFLSEIAASPTDLGEFDEDSGIWKPKKYSGTISSPSHFLEFKDGSDLGTATSGLDSDYQNNLTAADQSTDTPTNNFATLNLQVPNYVNTGGATEGGTKIPWSGVNSYGAFYATQGVTAGKWYWEFYIPSRSASYGLMNYVGLHTMEELILTSPYRSEAMKNNVFWLMHYGDWYAHVNGSQSSQNTVAGIASRGTEAVGRTYAIAFNADDGEMTYYENGTRISNLEFDIFDLDDRMAAGVFVVPWFQVYHNDMNVNFGGYSSIAISSGNTDGNGYGNFEYAPPSGYYALCSKNLAEYG